MEPTVSSETSAFILQTPGKFPKEYRLHSKHGESLKTTKNNPVQQPVTGHCTDNEWELILSLFSIL